MATFLTSHFQRTILYIALEGKVYMLLTDERRLPDSGIRYFILFLFVFAITDLVKTPGVFNEALNGVKLRDVFLDTDLYLFRIEVCEGSMDGRYAYCEIRLTVERDKGDNKKRNETRPHYNIHIYKNMVLYMVFT